MATDDPYSPPANALPATRAACPANVRVAFATGWVLMAAAVALFLLLIVMVVWARMHDARHGGGYALASALVITGFAVLPMAGIGGWLLVRYWPQAASATAARR